MGKSQSKTRPDDTDTSKEHGLRRPAVEEVYVQKIAYKCGVSEEELEQKKEAYRSHSQGDTTLGFQEFKCLYKDLSSGKSSEDFLQEYVEALFRAFDANKDDLLTFHEWQVGFYLLLLLPKDQDVSNVDKEEFLLAMEIIFRLYDQDGNAVVTKKEVGQMRSLLSEPAVARRLAGGGQLGKAVEGLDLDRYAGGINCEEFVNYFKAFLEETKTPAEN